MYKIGSLLTRRRIIVLTVCLVVLFLVWFIAFHGFLQAKNHAEDRSIYTYGFDSNLYPTEPSGAKSPVLTTSGSHLVQTPMKSGGIYLTESTAPHFLGTNIIDTPDFEASTTAMGRRTAPNLAMSKNGLVSWTSRGEVFKVNTKDPTVSIEQQAPLSFPNFSRVSGFKDLTQLSKSTVVGIRQLGDNRQVPIVYNFLNDKFVSFPTISATASDLSLRTEPNGFSIYDKKSKRVSFYNATSGDFVTKNVNQGNDIAIFNGRPVYSFNGVNDRLILATGPKIDSVEFTDEHDHTDEDSHTETKPESTVNHVTIRVFDTKTDKLLATRNLSNAPIKSIVASPDGKYIVVTTSTSMSFYTTNNLSQLFTLPYTAAGQGFWTKDGSFVFSSGTSGIIKASPKDKIALSILPYRLVRPSVLSFVDENNIYTTAYSSVNDYNKQPDAFRVSLTENTSSRDRKIFRAFPHQGEGFYVDRLNGVPTVQLSRYITSRGAQLSGSAKQDALEYVKSVIGNNEKVNFTYITTDLRTRDTGEE